jgi:hypothetical protein
MLSRYQDMLLPGLLCLKAFVPACDCQHLLLPHMLLPDMLLPAMLLPEGVPAILTMWP